MSAEVEANRWSGEGVATAAADCASTRCDGKPAFGSGEGRACDGRGDGGGNSSFGVVGGSGGRLGVLAEKEGDDVPKLNDSLGFRIGGVTPIGGVLTS